LNARIRDPDAEVDDKHKREGAVRINKLKRGKEIRRTKNNIARKAFARLRYIKYNYSDSEKRAQVETYNNMVRGNLCGLITGS